MNHPTLVALATVLMLPGIAGVALPAMPGIPYMLLVALGFGFVDKFQHLRSTELVALFLIAALSVYIDYAAGLWGARWGGASSRATAAGLIGLLIGTLLLPPFGGFIGLFLAVLYVELRGGTLAKALKAASGSLVGSFVGIVANLALAVLFLGMFILMALR